MSITLNDVGDYFPYNEERMARPVRAPWDRVEDDAGALRVVLVTKKKEAIRRGSFNSARLMQHFEELIT